jgi:hypothetical protein
VYPYNSAFAADADDYVDADCCVCTDADINAAVATTWPLFVSFFYVCQHSTLLASPSKCGAAPADNRIPCSAPATTQTERLDNTLLSEILEYKQIKPKETTVSAF